MKYTFDERYRHQAVKVRPDWATSSSVPTRKCKGCKQYKSTYGGSCSPTRGFTCKQCKESNHEAAAVKG